MRINLNVINHLDIDVECARSIDIAEFIESVIKIDGQDLFTLSFDILNCVDNDTCRSWVYEYHTNRGQVKSCVISTEIE